MNTLLSNIQEETVYLSKEFYQKIQESTSLNYAEGVTFYEKLWEILSIGKQAIGEQREVDIRINTILSSEESITIQAKKKAESHMLIYDLEQ